MSIQNVTLLGADGTLGPSVLHQLISHGFKLTVLKRASSKSPDDYPNDVRVIRVADEFSVDDLTKVLEGQHAVVATIKGSQVNLQERLAEACVRAGVRRFIPADFGSCDSSTSRARALVPLYERKVELRTTLDRLASENPAFSWTSLVCGHFADWQMDFLHMYPNEKRAEIVNDGTTKFSLSTLGRIGEATARVLQNPDQTANQMLYVQSFLTSQKELIAAFEKATGGQKWDVVSRDEEAFVTEEKAKADVGDLDAIENLVWVLGTVEANWTMKEKYAMKTLGLEDEKVEDVVGRVLKEMRS